VLEAVLQSCSTVNSQVESVPTIWPQENGGTVSAPATYRRPDDEHINSPQRPASALVSQSSFKSRSGSGPLQHSWVGSGGPLPSAAGNSPVATADVLPSRETALQNTQLALGRVLDTYGSGRKRDYKRLVPFVANSVRPGTAVSGKMY
jgi:hypothetical protein